MIQPYTRLKVADNSGAKELAVIQVIGGAKKSAAAVGDLVIAAVKSANPTSCKAKTILEISAIVQKRRE